MFYPVRQQVSQQFFQWNKNVNLFEHAFYLELTIIEIQETTFEKRSYKTVHQIGQDFHAHLFRNYASHCKLIALKCKILSICIGTYLVDRLAYL